MHTQDIDFKFRFVRDGQTINIFAKRGSADNTTLTLDQEDIPLNLITDSTTRDNRLVLTYDYTQLETPKISHSSIEPGVIVLDVKKIQAIDLERFIDRVASAKQLAENKKRLEQEGKAHLFKAVECPHCQSKIDLSELDKSQYIYCRFCESTFSNYSSDLPSNTYRVCSECSMFARVRPYTEFYFYFLVFIYGFSYKRRHLCDNCAGRLFWKVLAYNFIFLLGIPSALWMKLRSMSGKNAKLKELAKANRLARKGKISQAEPLYGKLYERYPDYPGFTYNLAIGKLRGGDLDGSIQEFQRSLKACSNYHPTNIYVTSLKDSLESMDRQ